MRAQPSISPKSLTRDNMWPFFVLNDQESNKAKDRVQLGMMLINLTVILLVRFGQAVNIWPKKGRESTQGCRNRMITSQ